MATVEEVLEKLKAQADPAQLEGMSRYGITIEQRLGVKIPEIRATAKTTMWLPYCGRLTSPKQ